MLANNPNGVTSTAAAEAYGSEAGRAAPEAGAPSEQWVVSVASLYCVGRTGTFRRRKRPR
jgi:hypothetical protein